MSAQRRAAVIKPILWTAREAAKALNVSERTLWTLTQTGKIPAVRIGKRGIRYDPHDIQAWIKRAKHQPKNA